MSVRGGFRVQHPAAGCESQTDEPLIHVEGMGHGPCPDQHDGIYVSSFRRGHVKLRPVPQLAGATPVIMGRLARPPLRSNRYGGE